MMLNNYQKTTLSNGLEVITDTISHVETVCVGLWNDVGARHESKEINGIAHLLEHMVFKGTTTRSAMQIAQSVDDIGAHMNAYTSKENTAYYIRCLETDLSFSLSLIADMILNPAFPEEELTREKGVILQEIGMYLDTPDDLIYDHFYFQAYGDTPYGRNILGPAERVKAMTRDDLNSYLKRFYHAGSMKIVAAGKVDHDAFCAEVEDLFSDLVPAPKQNEFEASIYQGGVHRFDKDLEQVHMLVGFQSFGYGSKDEHALQLLTSILGGGDSSRINQEVRENRGLAYSTYAYQDNAHDTGTLMIYAGTGSDVCDQTYQVICDEIKKLRDHGITDEELNRAKAQKRASLIMGAESTFARADRAGRQSLFYPELIDLNNVVARYEAVSREEIEALAAQILSSKPTLSFLGDVRKLDNNDNLLKSLS